MTKVVGPQIQTGGMELDDNQYYGGCPECKYEKAVHRNYDRVDGGCINQHFSIYCSNCGYHEDSAEY